MRMSQFLLENVEPILVQWEEFARTLQLSKTDMTMELLRDHAREMIVVIAHDIETAQSSIEQQRKSRGGRSRSPLGTDSPAQTHGGDRFEQGFTLNQIVSEYRALRASVIRLWTRDKGTADRSNLDELTRFNEAIDEAMEESVTRYTSRIDRERNLLVGALGHDLRNPLGAVVQSAQVLQAELAPGSSSARAAQIIVASSKRITALISDLLDFARAQLGDQLPIARAPMSIRDACQLAIDEISVLHPKRTLGLEAQDELLGNWDSARISQLLSNLIGNAAEHGSPKTTVRVGCYGTGENVFIKVHNQGAIPQSVRARIFEPLARASTKKRRTPSRGGNLGLGLYISCQIAKAHGGKIKVDSSAEAGTTFIVQLPRN